MNLRKTPQSYGKISGLKRKMGNVYIYFLQFLCPPTPAGLNLTRSLVFQAYININPCNSAISLISVNSWIPLARLSFFYLSTYQDPLLTHL